MKDNAYIFSDQSSLWGKREIIGFGNKDYFVKEIDKDLSNQIIIKNHYSKKVAGFATTYIYLGVFMKNELIGTLQFGFAMNAASMDKIVSGTGIYEYLELNRMWLHDKAGKNSESMAISYSIKFIKGKYRKVKWIQSFADERCGGFGIVYQAANFKFFGEHTSTFWELDDEWYHNKAMTIKDRKKAKKHEVFLQDNRERAKQVELRQFRYIYFINQKCIKQCLLKQKEYPKHYAEL